MCIRDSDSTVVIPKRSNLDTSFDPESDIDDDINSTILSAINTTIVNEDTTTQLSSDDKIDSPRPWTRVGGRMVCSPSNSLSSLANIASNTTTNTLANN